MQETRSWNLQILQRAEDQNGSCLTVNQCFEFLHRTRSAVW
ncbi:hypothetical protein CLOSTMETH_03870 [[Clostridium] methylpentosum DSM 5476]|uniref:Uncharacterized protein n=1 Tax=[Clostridium] methylpentosum DSM 5476 TaxID=537013 RepID=C0EJ24_9FIRM|nr:hypothetical protein CLOSTMETH_03870 [[Clostridium] methylpentosum DSM 5476]